MRPSAAALVLAALVLGALVSPAHAELGKCRLGVLKASGAYARLTYAARQRCEEAVVKGKVAACPDATVTAAVAKAAAKLDQLVAKACGGKNKVCDLADTGPDADDAPSTIGFPSRCPDYAGRSCGQTISGCADVGPCLRCVADRAVDDTADLAWGAFLVPSPDKAIVKCQRAIGRSSGALFAAISKAQHTCWQAVANGKVAGPCPVPGNAKAAAAIAKATAKQADAVCKACGGRGDRAPADGRCDGPALVDLAALGATSDCPAFTVPGGASCGGTIASFDDLARCHRCAATYAATCVDRAGVQGLVSFPPSCTGSPIQFVEAVVDGKNGVDGIRDPFSVAVSPDGKHVYVGGELDGTLAVFARNATTGALTFVEQEVNGVGGVTGISFVVAVTVSPDGKHVYTASIDGAVAVFARNATSGALTFGEAEIDGAAGVDGLALARDVVVSPDGAHVYAAGLGDDAVAIFTRNATTGALTYVGRVQDGEGGVDGIDGAIGLAFAPGGVQLYVAGNGDRAIAVFARNAGTGALTFVDVEKDGVNDVSGLFGVSGIAVSGDGKHLYGAAGTTSSLTTFLRDGATGALTFETVLQDGGAIDGLGGVGHVVVAPNGGAVFTTAEQDDAVAVFVRDPSTGALQFRAAAFDGIGGVDGLRSAAALAISPDGAHVYVAGFDDDAVGVFAVQ